MCDREPSSGCFFTSKKVRRHILWLEIKFQKNQIKFFIDVWGTYQALFIFPPSFQCNKVIAIFISDFLLYEYIPIPTFSPNPGPLFIQKQFPIFLLNILIIFLGIIQLFFHQFRVT